MKVTKEDVRNSWFEMVDGTLQRLFLSRAANIAGGHFTAEEMDKYISDKSQEYMEKYDGLSSDTLNRIMLGQMLSRLVEKMVEEDSND